MQKCSSCNKAVATVHVMDLQSGQIVGSHYLCEGCASAKGVVQNKANTIKVSTEILEDLLGGLKGHAQKASAAGEAAGELQCPGCAMTTAEFRMRGRMGCPQCYDVFRDSLVPLLERVHDATTHRGRFPGQTANEARGTVSVTELRQRLDRAIEAERYEEAAEIRDQLQRTMDEREADEG